MPEVLNPALYRRLGRLFGKVKISNAGEEMRAMPITDDNGEPRLAIRHAGEQYLVCCPFCHDTRNRLQVSYMFGKRDGHGRKMNFLAVCFNEGCLYRKENIFDFVDRLEAIDDFVLEEARLNKGKVVSDEAAEVQPPGPCELLNTLPPDHDAVVYMESRGFDITELSVKFGVSYCEYSHYHFAANRIIFPVIDRGKLKGWQARYIGELPWKTADKEIKRSLPPKYFSCPGSHFRSKCILNFDNMKQWQTGVMVEGPLDVCRGGSMFGGFFGNTVTDIQKRRLLAVFGRDRSLVHLFDPEEFNSRSTERLVAYMTSRMPGRFAAVCLPTGTDPGSLDRDWVKAYVKEQAADQGVKVVYRRVATTRR